MLLNSERERLVKLLKVRELARVRQEVLAAIAEELMVQIEAIVDAQALVLDRGPVLVVPILAAKPLGNNLNMLRQECGWSYDDMYEATGISKKLSIGHVHGAGITPVNLKLYADAFTEALGRSITVRDLLGLRAQ
jgi:hypothetical protein